MLFSFAECDVTKTRSSMFLETLAGTRLNNGGAMYRRQTRRPRSNSVSGCNSRGARCQPTRGGGDPSPPNCGGGVADTAGQFSDISAPRLLRTTTNESREIELRSC